MLENRGKVASMPQRGADRLEQARNVARRWMAKVVTQRGAQIVEQFRRAARQVGDRSRHVQRQRQRVLERALDDLSQVRAVEIACPEARELGRFSFQALD